MASQVEFSRRQTALAEFGDFVLDHEDLDEILNKSCRLIAKALDVDLAKVIEIESGANTGLVRAGIGWRPGIVGRERVSLAEASSEAFAIETSQPVITNDIARETRFGFPAFLREHGVIAVANVPILLPGRRPWGILQVDARRVREFDREDTEFLKTYAMALGPVIDRLRVAAEREEARIGMARREEHLRTVLEGIGELFYVLDREWRFLFASRSALRAANRRQEDVLGHRFLECFPQAEGSVAHEAMRRVMAGGPAENFETLSVVLKRWLNVSVTPTSDGGVSVVLQDIDDRKRAEAALRKSEERQAFLLRLSDALRPIADPIALQETASRLTAEHLDIGRATFCQISFEPEVIVVVERDWPRRGMPPVAPGRYRLDDFGPFLAEELVAGRPAVVADARADPRLTPTERENWNALDIVASCATPVFKEGRFVAYLVAQDNRRHGWTDAELALLRNVAERIWDAVERVRAEAALRESESRLAAAFESVPGGFAVVDANGKLVIANAEYRRFLPTGVIPSRDPDAGHRWQAWDQEGKPVALQDFPGARALRGESVVPGQEMLYTGDGRAVWTNVAAAPTFDAAGQLNGCVGFITDITRRKQAETALREAEERHREELERQVRERTAELQASRDLLQATMDASTDMIQVFAAVRDAAGEIVDFRWVLNNHTSESRYGEVRGESLLQRNPGVLVAGIFDAFKRVTESGAPEQAERHYAHEQFEGDFYQSVVKLGDGIATTTKDITEWKAAQASLLRLQEEIAAGRLRESEERFRLIVENVRDYAIFTTDLEGLVTSWPAGAAAVFGWTEAEMLGRPIDRSFTPEDVAASEPKKERETALREGIAPNVREHMRKDGSRIFIDGSIRPFIGFDGVTRGFIKIGQDVTESRRVQQALAESEERLRTLAEGIPELIWRSGDAGRWTWSSPQWRAFTGQALEESLGLGWLDAVHPDDREAVLRAWADAPATGAVDVEQRVRRAADGAYIWYQTRSLPVRDARGRVVEWLGASTDVQQLKQLQERQAVLVAELQHRTRNLIAVVRAVAGQTMAVTGPTEAFRDEFNHRLEALARVQGLLSRSDETPITMERLIRMELDAFGATEEPERVEISGPAVRIRDSVVQTLALALHELATNARKYGGLSTEQGRLVIAWRDYSTETGRRVALQWTETGGQPPDRGENGRRGYGRELIERALPYSLNAITTFEHDNEGLRCTIDIPLERTQSRRRTA